MKKLITIILLAVTSIAFAADFKLHLIEEDGVNTIAFTESDWEYLAKEDPYQLFINKGGFGKDQNNLLKMHTMIVFDKDMHYDVFQGAVRKIYSFGLVDCANAVLYLTVDFFTDANNKVLWMQRHELGSFVTYLDVPNTPREQVHIKMCDVSI